MRIHVFPQYVVESIREYGKAFVISITAPGEPEARIVGDCVHRFQFHDIREDLLVHNTLWRALDAETADRIVTAVVSNKTKKNTIIHCAAGISRSPAVALAISEFFDTDPNTKRLEEMYPCFNQHVRRMLVEAFKRRIQNEMDALDIGG